MPVGEDPTRSVELPTWSWLWMPLAVAAVPYLVNAWDPELYLRWIRSETGFVESVTALFLALAVGFGLAVLRRRERLPAQWLGVWIGLFVLGCIYFLGEEVSWGQHWFGWATPETLAAMNEQGETNLHNIGGWTEALLDQGPRSLLTLGAAVGGIAFPIWYRVSGASWSLANDWRPWLWPTLVVLPSAALALLSNLPRKVFPEGEVPAWLDIRGGESKECFLALFLMLYVASMWVRLKPAPEHAE